MRTVNSYVHANQRIFANARWTSIWKYGTIYRQFKIAQYRNLETTLYLAKVDGEKMEWTQQCFRYLNEKSPRFSNIFWLSTSLCMRDKRPSILKTPQKVISHRSRVIMTNFGIFFLLITFPAFFRFFFIFLLIRYDILVCLRRKWSCDRIPRALFWFFIAKIYFKLLFKLGDFLWPGHRFNLGLK